MAEELGKIEKPPVEKFAKGRKLFFVPLLYVSEDMPEEYIKLFDRYWEQVQSQVTELGNKLGAVHRVYHELIAVAGEEGQKAIENINQRSSGLINACLEKKASLEAVEDSDILTEFMDWSRCLMVGLQNPGVANKVYDAYMETGKKRNEAIARRIDETLQDDEVGLLLMRESHQVQFPTDIQVFYVSPPALDEIKRWLREQETKTEGKSPDDGSASEEKTD